jgi:alkylation response protein AidB-like acyl-CoA dehydrogenase
MLGHYGVSTSIVLPYLPIPNPSRSTLAARHRHRRHDAVFDDRAWHRLGSGRYPQHRQAPEDGSHYILNATKTFITGARNSELCVVVARTSRASADDRRTGLSLLVVPTDSEGFEIGRKLDKIGLHASDTSELSFTNVLVPVENLLGDEGQGFAYLGQNLARERLAIGVEAAARAQAGIELARTYTRERTI